MHVMIEVKSINMSHWSKPATYVICSGIALLFHLYIDQNISYHLPFYDYIMRRIENWNDFRYTVGIDA